MPGQDVIRPRGDPIKPFGSMAVLHGNLAPRGAVIKQSAASPELMTHRGRAVVFDSVQDMTERIDDPALDVTADDVLVLRNAGPRGAPGMPEAGYLPIPRKLAQQGVKDMVRISDARMSGTAFGTIVLHIDARVGGRRPARRSCRTATRSRSTCRRAASSSWSTTPSSRADARRSGARRAAARPSRPSAATRALFHRSVLQADEGCDFDFLVPGRSTQGSAR